jgi:hypothetical protein
MRAKWVKYFFAHEEEAYVKWWPSELWRVGDS